jgi:hypothetical protein
LPPCENLTVEYQPGLAAQHIRCELSLAGLTIDVSSDPAWSFALRDGGGVIQRFREPTDQAGETGAVPLLQDIDGSGTPVLLVVTGRGGTGGEPMAVWRLSGGRLVRAGELFGFRHFYRTPEGFFGNYAHSSAASGVVTLYRWVDNRLVALAMLDMRAAAAVPDARPDWVRNGAVLCALSDDDEPAGPRAGRADALRAAGIDPATAQQRFCTQSWVASVYQ